MSAGILNKARQPPRLFSDVECSMMHCHCSRRKESVKQLHEIFKANPHSSQLLSLVILRSASSDRRYHLQPYTRRPSLIPHHNTTQEMPFRRFSGCLGSSSEEFLQLTIGVCTDPVEGEPNHWILILTDDDAEYATCYHSLGGPTKRRPWELVIESGELRSWDADYFYYVAEISARHQRKVNASANKTPSGFSQRWVVRVLWDLELQKVVPPGTTKRIAQAVEEDPYADASPIVEKHKGFRDQMFDWAEKHCLSRLGLPGR